MAMETIMHHVEQMHLKDANTNTRVVNSNRHMTISSKISAEIATEKYTQEGDNILPCILELVYLLPEIWTFHLCLFQNAKQQR